MLVACVLCGHGTQIGTATQASGLCIAGGNLVGGIVGLFWRVLVGRQAWLAMALSCSTAIAAMEMTSLQYPPGMLSIAAKKIFCPLALNKRSLGARYIGLPCGFSIASLP